MLVFFYDYVLAGANLRSNCYDLSCAAAADMWERVASTRRCEHLGFGDITNHRRRMPSFCHWERSEFLAFLAWLLQGIFAEVGSWGS